ncbi:MAG TPA: decaprenyl-phosphate phosphoribosyltransferase [Ktedonobacterales bacterium]|nr:decaprenyl-phosphate phosphoribosyltransferase [Ktedonobacterales bacterium]
MRTSYSEDKTSAALSESAALAGAPTRQRAPGVLGQLALAIALIRPKQWTKNGLVLLALIFARRATDLGAVERVLTAFFAFCLAASVVYVINDIADREKDRQHPVKRNRPIASGRLMLPVAWMTAVLCACGSAVLVAVVMAQEPLRSADPFGKWGGSALLFALTLGSYVVMNLLYSSWLKHQVLWDVFIIAAGFVLRALAGAFAIPVPISPWFYLCTTFLALFLALGKRRAELVLLSDDAANARSNLREYNLVLLDQLLAVVVTCVLITYSLYTFQGENASHTLMITIPFVIFGVFRYLYLLYVKGEGERPDELLWRDRQILGSVVLCVVAVMVLLYGIPFIHG